MRHTDSSDGEKRRLARGVVGCGRLSIPKTNSPIEDALGGNFQASVKMVLQIAFDSKG
jgi:hypothetical protein